MPKCSVRWRSSGGRGEFEFVPSTSLNNRRIFIKISQLGVTVDSEVVGQISQGKPRLRKLDPNNRQKLHLVQLVMAVARLPEPAREDKGHTVIWPLEDKRFVVSEIDFDIVDDDGTNVVLVPLEARILHSPQTIDLQHRFNALAKDLAELASISTVDTKLTEALKAHQKSLAKGKNSAEIKSSTDMALHEQKRVFGKTNGASPSTLLSLPFTPFEENISGKEGKLLTRLHVYKERDRAFIKKAKAQFFSKYGRLFCECCGHDPVSFYGLRGESRIHAHHRIPVEELLEDSEVKPEDLAMVCPNCHDIIHSKRPWISVEDLRAELVASKKTK